MIMAKCKICCHVLTPQNSNYKSELCKNCQQNMGIAPRKVDNKKQGKKNDK